MNTIGTIVQYRLTVFEAERVNERLERAIKAFANGGDLTDEGNQHNPGDVLPMIITRVIEGDPVGEHDWERKTRFNGQVILDANFSLWVSGAVVGNNDGDIVP